MKNICFSKYLIMRVKLFCLGACPTVVYLYCREKLFVISVLIFTIDIANVAHISPVPVLNCELLNGPEPCSEGVFVLTGKSEQSLKLVSKAAESSPNICGW